MEAQTPTKAELLQLLPYLTPQELARLDKLLPLWSPLPGPQTLAYHSQADVLGYGGAAGGGKTDLLIGLGLTKHERSIIFRREAMQNRAMIDRSRELIGLQGSFNENTGTWRRLPGGRQIEFAGVKDAGDEQRYKGRPHDLVAFDEADQFIEHQVRFLQGWLRTTKKGQPCQCVLCFNPPSSAEGRWIIDYFGPWIDPKHPRPAKPGELRWFARLKSGEEVERPGPEPFQDAGQTVTPKSRSFIPALVTDNPMLMATGYFDQLNQLPEPLRSQMLRGDMTAGLEDDRWQVIPTAWVEAAMSRWTEDGGKHVRLSCIGTDVARGGDDQTVLARRHETWFAPMVKASGKETTDGPSVGGMIEKELLANAGALINIDGIGVGSAVFDYCVQRGHHAAAIMFSAGTKARDRSGVFGFANLRAYGYWSLRELLDPSEPMKLALPPDRELLLDLTAPRWKPTLRGILIEEKEAIRKRIGRSPDCGDAVVLSILLPV